MLCSSITMSQCNILALFQNKLKENNSSASINCTLRNKTASKLFPIYSPFKWSVTITILTYTSLTILN